MTFWNSTRTDIDFGCMDCDFDCSSRKVGGAEYYMVNTDIWEKVHDNFRGFLCIGCLEDRLGRQLVHSDFMSTMYTFMKNGVVFSDRLKDRFNEGRY